MFSRFLGQKKGGISRAKAVHQGGATLGITEHEIFKATLSSEVRMNITNIILSLCFVIVAASLSHGKEWRGIVPLHSTRTDVERLLGPPAEKKNELMSVYKLDQKDVVLEYPTGLPY